MSSDELNDVIIYVDHLDKYFTRQQMLSPAGGIFQDFH